MVCGMSIIINMAFNFNVIHANTFLCTFATNYYDGMSLC